MFLGSGTYQDRSLYLNTKTCFAVTLTHEKVFYSLRETAVEGRMEEEEWVIKGQSNSNTASVDISSSTREEKRLNN